MKIYHLVNSILKLNIDYNRRKTVTRHFRAGHLRAICLGEGEGVRGNAARENVVRGSVGESRKT